MLACVWVGRDWNTKSCVVEMTMTRSRLVNVCAIKVVHYIHCTAVTLLGYVIMGGITIGNLPHFILYFTCITKQSTAA